jgi:hypothetical protein
MSNRLTSLSADLADLQREIVSHEISGAEKTIAAGKLLIEAKALAGHGAWLPFLTEAGVSARTAQRYMRLAASPLNATLVTHLGGITDALAFLADWRMPEPGQALHVTIGEGDDENFAFVWRDDDQPEHVMIAALVAEQSVRTKRPMLPLIEVEGDQPVDTVIAWLEAMNFGSIAEWRVETVDGRLARSVIDPIIWFAMTEEYSGGAV